MSYNFSGLEYLYIHWPFCAYKCHFCDFVAMASHEQFMYVYHQALMKELSLSEDTIKSDYLKTIYLGGGTPSTYPNNLLLDMFDKLKEKFNFDESTEITIEVNPGTVNKEALKLWKEIGINRLSVGVQSLNDKLLASLNRHQTSEDVYTFLKNASGLFENISVDFILGLPGVSNDEWKKMIREAMNWPIKHISVYFLMVHEKTPLFFKVKMNKVSLPLDDDIVDLYDWTVETLKKNGFNRYELSNFAKSDFESRHNQAYWNRYSYRGFGLGACSFNGSERFANDKNLGKYLEKIKKNQFPIETVEKLTKEHVLIEKIMLGLRCHKGMDVEDYISSLEESQKINFFSSVKELQHAGLVELSPGIIRLTAKGFSLENEVAVRLFPE